MAFSFKMPVGMKGKTPPAGSGADSMDMTSMSDASGEGTSGEESKEPSGERDNEKQLGAAVIAAIKSGNPDAVYEAICACK